MSDLIERLEKATGPDRELGNEVLLACGWRIEEHGDGPDRHVFWCGQDDYADGDQPDPTASLDAALTLVDDFWLELAVYHEGVFGAHAWLHAPEHLVSSKMIVWGDAHLKPSQSISFKDAHDLYPIAICVAALRAANKQALSGR